MSEPVAFVDKIWIERPDLVMSQQLDIGRLFMRSAKEIKNYIPLYTHPHTENFSLTDEEITECCKKVGVIIHVEYLPSWIKELSDELIKASRGEK